LAINAEGELLTIELKAASDTAKIDWSPAQARHYARLFQHWAQGDPQAADVMEDMLDQRIELGLAGDLRRDSSGRSWSGPLSVSAMGLARRRWSGSRSCAAGWGTTAWTTHPSRCSTSI
jgi:hypothetical protein